MELAQKFQEYVGNPSNMVNKAKLYDKGMLQLRAASGQKIVWFLVDYAVKIDRILAAIRVLFVESKTTPLENIPDISVNTTDLPSLEESMAQGLQEMSIPPPNTAMPEPFGLKPTGVPGSVTWSKSHNQKELKTPLSIYK